jgi:phosphate starvation-inducible PhoH-like protein
LTVTIEVPIDSEKESDFFNRELGGCLKPLEEVFKIVISSRGNRIFIQGDEKNARMTEQLIHDIYDLRRDGLVTRPEDIRNALKSMSKDDSLNLKNLIGNYIHVANNKKHILPKTETQRHYVECIKRYDIVIGIGPAGTGKTYLAMAMAVNAYMKKRVSRIILARPAVEAGEKLGYLPGNMYEKVNPYLRPLYDALYEMMDVEKAASLVEKGIIEIAPLAFMRGRTLNDAFVILDEAQNTTSEQMKMYLTRLGFNSKTVITGDITQIDLPQDRHSGLIDASHVLKDIEGIKFVHFSDKDVVRHKLVQEIVKAYERSDKR